MAIRELRLGVQEWGEVLEAVGGKTGIESVTPAPPVLHPALRRQCPPAPDAVHL